MGLHPPVFSRTKYAGYLASVAVVIVVAAVRRGSEVQIPRTIISKQFIRPSVFCESKSARKKRDLGRGWCGASATRDAGKSIGGEGLASPKWSDTARRGTETGMATG